MQRAIIVDEKGNEIIVDITVGAVEALALLEKGAKLRTIKDKLKKYVSNPNAIDSPIYFFKIVEAIGVALKYHQERSEREPSPRDSGFSPRKDAIFEAFSTLKYAFAQKLHTPPHIVSDMYIDEAFDYIVLMKAEGRYYEKLQKGIGRARPLRR